MFTRIYIHILVNKERIESLSSRSHDIGDSGVTGCERHVAGVYITHEDIDNWERAEQHGSDGDKGRRPGRGSERLRRIHARRQRLAVHSGLGGRIAARLRTVGSRAKVQLHPGSHRQRSWRTVEIVVDQCHCYGAWWKWQFASVWP